MAKQGKGRRVRQYNPGAQSLGEYVTAVTTHKRHHHDASGKIIHDTPKAKREEFASAIWARRKAHERNPESGKARASRYRAALSNPELRRNLFGFGHQATSAVASKAAFAAGEKSGDTGLFDQWFSKSKWKKDTSLRTSLRREYERGFEAEHQRTISARRTSHSSETTRRTSLAKPASSYKGARIWATAEGDWKTNLDPESSFDTEADVKSFVNSEKKRNPASTQALPTSEIRMRQMAKGRGGYWSSWSPWFYFDSITESNGRLAEMQQDANFRRTFFKWEVQRKDAAGWSHYDYDKGSISPAKKRNPEDAAAAKFEEFHGKPSGEEILIEEEYRYHENLTALGDLCQIKCKTVSGYDAAFDFCGYDEKSGAFDEEIPESERPILCCSEDGRQLYVLGGDQALDLGEIKMDSGKWPRDSMVIGEAYMVTYQTAKAFDSMELTSYYHTLSEDSGIPVQMIYDKLNDQIQFAGGGYEVLPEGGDATGKGGSIYD